MENNNKNNGPNKNRQGWGIILFTTLLVTPGDLEMPFRKGQMLFTAFHMAEGTAKPEQVNMKFMLNGAPTLGTMDGANVQLRMMKKKKKNQK